MSRNGVLANVPGLGGYLAQGQYNQDEAMGRLQQLGALSNLSVQMEKRKLEDAARQKQAQFDAKLGELGPDAKPEDVLGLAMRSGMVPAKDLLNILQGAENKKAQVRATGEQTMARLAQAKAISDREFDLKLRSATREDEKLDIARQRAESDAFYKAKAADVAQGRAVWEFGYTPSPSLPTAPAPKAAPSLGGSTVQGQFGDVGLNLQGASPGMLAAARAQPELRGNMDALAALGGGAVSQAPQAPSAPVAPFGSVPEQAPAAPNNLDARDLRLQQAPQATAVPSAPQMPAFTGSPKQQAEAKNKWLAEQNKASISGSGTLSPTALNNLARQYLAGDRQAIQGFARSTTARVAIQNAITDEMAKQGKSPEQVAAAMAEFAGTMAGSRTVGTRAANISLAATEAQEMIGLVRETSDEFKRTSFVPWNKALAAFESGTGRPEVVRFGASLNALVNVYARAIAPSGVPTISDKDHAREVVNRAQSPEQTEAVLDIINRELEIAKKAPRQVRESLRESVAPSGGNGQWRVVR